MESIWANHWSRKGPYARQPAQQPTAMQPWSHAPYSNAAMQPRAMQPWSHAPYSHAAMQPTAMQPTTQHQTAMQPTTQQQEIITPGSATQNSANGQNLGMWRWVPSPQSHGHACDAQCWAHVQPTEAQLEAMRLMNMSKLLDIEKMKMQKNMQ
jgi:hypothetical protein